MIIYWGFLVLSLLVHVWVQRDHYIVDLGYTVEKRATLSQGFLFFGVLCFFCGLRSGIADTGTYIQTFNGYPSDLSIAMESLSTVKDKGFYLFSVFYKQFISQDYHGWLFLIALVSCYATMKAFRRYSSEFGLSCFLFIATALFTYLINGMRQYIVISILLACSHWITEKKYLKYIVLILLMSTIHASAIIFIPVLFLVNSKPWSFRMILLLAITIAMGSNFDLSMSVLENSLEGTAYDNYVGYIANEGVGGHIIRLVLAALPVGLAFLEKNTIEQEGTPFINLAVNMSTINFCIYIIGTITSGMAMARLATYFDIYNVILLPWLIEHYGTGTSRKTMRTAMILLYIIYFWYQMTVAWSVPYESDILGLYIYH